MANNASRTAKRLLLGQELAHLIDDAQLTQTDAGRVIEKSQGQIASLIAGTATITVGDLERLAKWLGVTDEGYMEALLSLRRDNHKRGFWTTGHNRAYAEDYRLMVDLERHADLMRAVGVELMPGLLQCEAYVRAFHQDVIGEDADVSLEDRIKARLARQEVLLKDDAPEYRVVMSESCLDREYGSPEVMREQIAYLMKKSREPNVLVQVMPYKLRARRVSMSNPFIMIRVPSPGLAGPLEIAYVQGEGEIRYLDDAKALAAHDRAWSRLSDAALNTEDTRKFLRFKLAATK